MSSSLGVFRCEDEDRGEEDNREALFSKQRQVDRLTNMLSDKLSEFLSSSFPYSLKRVPSTHVGNLYKGPTEGTVSTEHLPLTLWSPISDAKQAHHSIPLLQHGHGSGGKAAVQHPIKGGYVITDYLIYDWLVCICNFLFCTLYDDIV